MKCSICHEEMERLEDRQKEVEAIEKIGIPYGGRWRCPKRIHHHNILIR